MLHGIAPFENEHPVHSDAMHWVNWFTLYIKLKAMGQADQVPEFDDKYFEGWIAPREELLGCIGFDFRNRLFDKHAVAVHIVDEAIDKVRRGENLTLAEIGLLEDLYVEISGCKRRLIYY